MNTAKVTGVMAGAVAGAMSAAVRGAVAFVGARVTAPSVFSAGAATAALLAVAVLTFAMPVSARESGSEAAGERAELYGFAPAYPAEALPAVAVEGNQPYTPHKRMVRVVLEIDESGAVTRARAADTSLARYAEYLDPYAKGLRFVPAEFEGQVTASQVAMEFLFDPRWEEPEVYPAVDHSGQAAGSRLYFETFPLNGVELPKVEMFPSLFVELHWSDTALVYPYVLLKLSLDASGRVTAAESVRSTIPSFTQTTINASLWGEYEPLRVKGEPRAAEVFVLVSYFPQVIYPTKDWRAEATGSAPVMERERIRLIPDTVGLMARPVPRVPTGDSAEYSVGRVYSDRDTSGAFFAIDARGQLSVQAFDMTSGDLTKALRKMTGTMKYYPALDFAGEPRSFRGLVQLTGQASGRVRIKYVW